MVGNGGGERNYWSVGDFGTKFANKYYSCQHQKNKEQDFLILKQGDITILEYKRQF
jgi:hypothetical protein